MYRRRYENRRSSKPKLHFKKKYGEKRFSIWQIELLHSAMWHDHDIDFARWLHPAMWHNVTCYFLVTYHCMWLWNRDSEFNKWQHPAMRYVTLGWHADELARWQHVPAMCQMALRWHSMEFAQTQTSAVYWNSTSGFRFWPQSLNHRSRHVILHQSASAKFSSKSDHPQHDVMSIFKMADLGHLGF